MNVSDQGYKPRPSTQSYWFLVFSNREIATAAVAFPIRFVTALASDINRSIPKIKARPKVGMEFTIDKVDARVTEPLPVTPAAPFEVRRSIELC